MSSTNRSNARNYHISDYYVTPVDEIVNFLNEFRKIEPDIYNMKILDSCAGGDSKHPMSYPEAFYNIKYKNKIHTIDIREDSLADEKADYLKTKLTYQPDIIISNPPFSLAMEFIEKSLQDVKNGGWVIYLLRLNFLESKKRKEFFDKHMPAYLFVHHARMSFTDNGTTDSVAYCHMCWKKGYNPEFAKIKII